MIKEATQERGMRSVKSVILARFAHSVREPITVQGTIGHSFSDDIITHL
jgi:hypothetical protein